MQMPEIDLKSHVDFFDRLVELIPAKHYLADPDERVDLRHMKKKDRQAAKEQFKKQHKETKKASLNPSTAKGTLELLKLKSEAEEQARSAGGGKEAAKGPVDREALRAKLQARLEDLRKQRKADEQEKKVDSAKHWRDSALEEGRKKAVEKRKQEALKPSGGKQSQQEQQDRRPAKQQRIGGAPQQQPQGGNAVGNVGGAGLTFSKVDFGNGASSSDRRKGKHKLSKAELLQEAEQRQTQQGASAGDAGEEQEAWGAALKRAQGEKVFDDPKLLRKSMKKEAKMKEKKSKVWNERLEKQKEGQEAKQAKRRTNLQRRVDAKKEAKKAKREKKLLRAGFEGRKKTFITTPSPKPPPKS